MKDAYKNTAALFESALEAVIGTDGEQVVFMNPAAVSALGEHRGEALSSLLPAEALGLVPGQVAALTLCGRRASLRAASAPGLKVFFVAFDEPQKSLPERAGFLPELRSLLSGLKLAADRLSEAAEAAGGQEALERAGLLQHTCAQLQRLVGNNFKYLMPATMLSGAIFMLIVDNLCRNLTTTEIPVGILTAFVGAPFFIYLITREGDRA